MSSLSTNMLIAVTMADFALAIAYDQRTHRNEQNEQNRAKPPEDIWATTHAEDEA